MAKRISMVVLNQNGEELEKKVNLNGDVFGIEPNTQVMFDAVQVYQTKHKRLQKQKLELKFAVVVKSHGDKKALVELELDQVVHQFGLVVEQSSDQLETKTSN